MGALQSFAKSYEVSSQTLNTQDSMRRPRKRRPIGNQVRALASARVKYQLLTTFSNGYLGSCDDEERSEMRYVMRIAERESSSL